jgi:predicted glycosyltransferase
MINSLASLNFLQLPITKKRPIIKTDYKEKADYKGQLQKKKKNPSTNLHQTTPEEKHLIKTTGGDIVHK